MTVVLLKDVYQKKETTQNQEPFIWRCGLGMSVRKGRLQMVRDSTVNISNRFMFRKETAGEKYESVTSAVSK